MQQRRIQKLKETMQRPSFSVIIKRTEETFKINIWRSFIEGSNAGKDSSVNFNHKYSLCFNLRPL